MGLSINFMGKKDDFPKGDSAAFKKKLMADLKSSKKNLHSIYIYFYVMGMNIIPECTNGQFIELNLSR